MVCKSRGPRRRTRAKYSKNRKMTVNQFMRTFDIGDTVALFTEPGSHSGMPFRRFFGLTGKVTGTQGNAYLVAIYDGNKLKSIIAKPEHLKKV